MGGETEGFHFLMTSSRGTRGIPLGTSLSAESDVQIIRWGLMYRAYENLSVCVVRSKGLKQSV